MSKKLFTPHEPDYYAQKERERAAQETANKKAQKAAAEKKSKAATSEPPAPSVYSHAEPLHQQPQKAAQATTKPKQLSQPYQSQSGGYVADYQNNQGEVKQREVKPKIDTKTGDKWIPEKNEFGETTRKVIGKDERTVKKIRFQKQLDVHKVELSARTHQRDVFKRDWDPVKTKYEAATAKLEKIDSSAKFRRNDEGKWVDKDGLNIENAAELAQWQASRKEAVTEVESVRKKYEGMKPQMEALQKAAQAAEDKAHDLKQQQLRHEYNMPQLDGGMTARIARQEQAEETGVESPGPIMGGVETNAAMLSVMSGGGGERRTQDIGLAWENIESQNDFERSHKAMWQAVQEASEAPGRKLNDLVKVLEEGNVAPKSAEDVKKMAGALPPVQGTEIVQDGDAYLFMKGKDELGRVRVDGSGEVIMEVGTRFHNPATLSDISKLTESPVRVFLNTQYMEYGGFTDPSAPMKLGKTSISDGAGGTMQVSVPENNVQRMTGVEEANYVRDAVALLADEEVQEEEKTARLLEMGASPMQIMERMDRGVLSLNAGQALGKIYGMNFMPTDPRDPATFQKWLEGNPEIKQRRAEAVARYKNRTGKDGKNESLWIKPLHWMGNSAADVFGKADNAKEIATLAEIDQAYFTHWATENMDKPGVDRYKVGELYKEGLDNDLGISDFDKTKEKWRTSTQNALGSTVGIFGGLAIAGHRASGPLNMLRHVGMSDEYADKVIELNTKATLGYMKGLETNIRKFLRSDGKEVHARTEKSAEDLFSLIDMKPKYLDGIKKTDYEHKIKSAANLYARNAYERMGVFTTGASTMERGEARDYDPSRNPALQAELYAYMRTGNPAHKERFKALALMTPGQRGLETDQALYMKQYGGDNLLWQSIIGGTTAGYHEMAIEVVSDALGAGLAKAALRAQKAMRVGGKALGEAHTMGAMWRNAGLFKGTINNPLGITKKTINSGVKGAKAMLPGTVGEGFEELIAELGNPNISMDLAFHAIEQGMMGGVAMGGGMAIIGKPMAMAADAKEKGMRRNQHVEYSQWYNKNFSGEQGYAPITPADVEMADSLVNLEENAAARKEYQAAIKEASAAQAGIGLKPTDAGIERAGKAMDRLAAAEAELGMTQINTLEAVAEIAGLETIEERTYWRGVAKVAAGKNELLTENELKAISGAVTEGGSNYFEQNPDGLEVLTTEARAEIAEKMPAVGQVVRTSESFARESEASAEVMSDEEILGGFEQENTPVEPNPNQAATPAQQETPVTVVGQPADAQQPQNEASTSEAETNAPTANPSKNQGAGEPAQSGQHKVLSPGGSVSPIVSSPHAGVGPESSGAGASSPVGEGLPSRPSTLSPPSKQVASPENIAATKKAEKNTAKAKSVAGRAITRAVKKYPSLKGRIEAVSKDLSGPAEADSKGRIRISIAKVADEVGKFDGKNLDERMDRIIREEMVHNAQFKALDRIRRKQQSKASLAKFSKDHYQNIWDGMRKAQRDAAVEAYGARVADWKQAAEAVRALVQDRENGKVTELTKAFAKDTPETLLAHLKEMLAVLKEMVAEGMGGLVSDTVEAVEAILAEAEAQPAAKKDKPKLTDAEQALADAFSELDDDLLAASPLDTYKKAIPAEKMGNFIAAAQKMIAGGVNTPEGLAAAIDKITAKKARPFTDAVWSALRMVDPSLDPTPNWESIYKSIGSTSKPAAKPSQGKEGIIKEIAKRTAEMLDPRRHYGAAPIKKADILDGLDTEGLTAKELEEMIESGVAEITRDIASDAEMNDAKFRMTQDIYRRQPKLGEKTTTSKVDQAYSTPAPFAFAAHLMLEPERTSTVYEPSAGHGILAPNHGTGKTYLNELNGGRFARLRLATNLAPNTIISPYNALNHDLETKVDRVIANPPFGKVLDEKGEAQTFQTPYGETKEIDHAILIKSLDQMKDNGRAVFLIGGPPKTVVTPDGRRSYYGAGKRRDFFDYLHDNYGVVDHFTVAGKLYEKQGAGWPIDVIVIRGRGKSKVSRPYTKGPRQIQTWEKLYEQTELTDQQRIALNTITEAEIQQDLGALDKNLSDLGSGFSPVGETQGDTRSPSRKEPSVGAGDSSTGDALRDTEGTEKSTQEPAVGEPDGGVAGGNDRNTRSADSPVGDGKPQGTGSAINPDAGSTKGDAKPERVNSFQHTYAPYSGEFTLGTLVPSNMAAPLDRAFAKLKKDIGTDLTSFVRDELGYSKNTDITPFLAGEQIDALALAIYNFQRGGALIIGDQTGIGKGRIAAGLIKYAINNNLVPVFVSETQDLLGQMIDDDLADIQVTDVRPAITDNNLTISAGRRLNLAHGREVFEEIERTGELPEGHNAIFTTYYQITSDTAPGSTPAEKARAVKDGQVLPHVYRHGALRRMAPKSVYILDESHNASGQSMLGVRMVDLLRQAKHTYYSSATAIKRPENLKLYFKTSIGQYTEGSESGVDDLMTSWGVPGMQVVSSMLVEEGQMMRRERTYEGVKFNTKVMTETAEQDIRNADSLTASLYEIVKFQTVLKTASDHVNKAINRAGKSLSIPSKAVSGIETQNFSSKLHNVVSQYLMAVKLDAVVAEAKEQVGKGNKVVVALMNTMESALEALTEGGFDLSYKGLMLNYLDKMRYVSPKKVFGKIPEGQKPYEITGEANPEFEDLDDQALTRKLVTTDSLNDEPIVKVNMDAAGELMRRYAWREYERSRDFIEGSEIADLPLSPIDHMRQQMETEGVKTGEITGRSLMMDEDGNMVPRPTSHKGSRAKERTIAEFQNEDLDFLVLNESGSTGISLHASDKAANQTKRVMIVAQAHLDINRFMQFLGRIHRSGQVTLPEFVIMQTALPAETRPAAARNKKLRGLNASTTSNDKNSVSEGSEAVDVFNKYGDEIAIKIIREDPDLQDQLKPFGSGSKNLRDLLTGGSGGGVLTYQEAKDKFLKDKPDGSIVSSVTGYLAVLPAEEQAMFWDKMFNDYLSLIDYLDQIGKNDLEAKAMDLKAETISTEVIAPATGGDSIFSAEAVLEKVETKSGRAPLTLDEVKEVQEKSKQNVNKRVGEFRSQSAQLIKDHIAARKSKAVKWDQEKEDRMRQEMKAKANTIGGALARLGQFGVIERDGGGTGMAIIEEINLAQESLLAPSKHIAIVRVNDSRDRLRIPLSKLSEAVEAAPYATPEEWNESRSTSQKRQIVTGNLYAAMVKLQGTGSIISYTKADGTENLGILLPMNFKRASLDVTQVPVTKETVKYAIADLQVGEKITGSGGDIVIRKSSANQFWLGVKSTNKYRKAWGNSKLLSFVPGGEMAEQGSKFTAQLDNQAEAMSVLETLMGLDFPMSMERKDTETLGASPLGDDSTPQLDISTLSVPPSSYTYEPARPSNIRIREIAEQRGIEVLTSSQGLRASIVRFERSTGLKIQFYRGGEENTSGFVVPSLPSNIFINAEAKEASLSSLLAHEWTHAAAKDSGTGMGAVKGKVFSLLTKREKIILKKHLENRDESYVGRWVEEVIPYFMGDAISGLNEFGLGSFKNAQEITAILKEAYNNAGELNPSGLDDTDTDEYSTTSDGQTLFASPLDGGKSTPPEDQRAKIIRKAIESALKNTPPIFRTVFVDSLKNAELTPEQLAHKHGLSERAIINIIAKVRSRMVSAMKAQTGTLKPKTKHEYDAESGQFHRKIDSGSPDLSLGANETVAAVDQIRNEEGVREDVETHEEVRNRARAMIEKDGYRQTYDKLIDIAARGETYRAADVVAAQIIIAAESVQGRASTTEEKMKLASLINAYRDVGTQTARELAARRDPDMSPAERMAKFVTESFYSPDQQARKEMDAADTNALRNAALRRFIQRMEKVRQALKVSGIDIDAAFAKFKKGQETLKEQAETNPDAANVIKIAIKKADPQTQAIVETIMQGQAQGTDKQLYVEQASRAAGIPLKETVQKYYKFLHYIADVRREAMAKGTEMALAASPLDASVMLDLEAVGLPDISDIFEEDGKAKPQKKKRKKAKKKDIETDLNDPADQKLIAIAMSVRNANKWEKLLEWRKMAILTGPQTHLVNSFSNFAYTSYENGPIRLTQATTNHILELVGWKDKELESARFGDYQVLASKHLAKAVVRGAQNAMSSFTTGDRVFYDQALGIVDEINSDTGIKGDRHKQALDNFAANILRKFSFGALTVADEFAASIVGSLEATAHAHRIAKSEKLKGEAYDARMEELLEYGSESWEYGVKRAKKMTFQDDIMETKSGEHKPIIDATIDAMALWVKNTKKGVSGKGFKKAAGVIVDAKVPFVDTPANIAKVTLKLTPHSGLVGAGIDILHAAGAARATYKNTKDKAAATKKFAAIYNRARFIEDIAYQLNGWAIYFALKALLENIDDDELPWITGTMPYTQANRTKRDLSYGLKMGPSKIRLPNGYIIDYSRFEPMGSQLALTVDMIKGDAGHDPMMAVGKIISLTKDKTYMRGIADIFQMFDDMATLTTEEKGSYENDRARGGLARMVSNDVGSLLPNIFKQPFRNNTDHITQDDINPDDGFLPQVASGIVHNVAPWTSPAKVEVFGKEVERNPGDPIFGIEGMDPIARALTPMKYTRNAKVDSRIQYIYKFTQQNEGNADYMKEALNLFRNPSRTIKRGGVSHRMNATEYREYQIQTNRKASAMLGTDWENRPVNIQGIRLMKKALSKARSAQNVIVIRNRAKELLEARK